MNSNKPLTRWRCDRCGEWIEDASKGYVIWGSHGDTKPDFEIIHQGKCDNDAKPRSQPLNDFLGSDGLARLTSMLSYGIVRDCEPPGDLHRVHDLDQFVDFMRRVQLPNYEEARSYLLSAEAKEELSSASESYPYLQKHLKDAAKSVG